MPGFIELEKLATMAKNDRATGGKDSHEKASGHREDQRDAVQFSACRWGGGGELLHGAPTCEVSFVSFHPEILVAPSVSQFSHSVVSDSL